MFYTNYPTEASQYFPKMIICPLYSTQTYKTVNKIFFTFLRISYLYYCAKGSGTYQDTAHIVYSSLNKVKRSSFHSK